MVRMMSMDEGICRIGNWRAAGGWPLRLGRTVELLAGVAPREAEACQAIEERKVGPRSYQLRGQRVWPGAGGSWLGVEEGKGVCWSWSVNLGKAQGVSFELWT